MKRIYILLIFVILGGGIATAQNNNVDTLTSPIGTANVDTLNLDSIFPHIQHEWISYQMKIALDMNHEKLAFQCFFVNRIDSIIYLNVNKSGIELARIVFTPDSVIYVNKLEHKYYCGQYEFTEKILGLKLNFDIIQSLLNAVDFAGFTNNFTRVEEDGKLQYISPLRKEIDGDISIMQSIELGENGVIVENDITELKNLRDITLSYKDYNNANNFNFFSKLSIEMEVDEISMEAEIKNLKINQSGPTRIKIPDSFEEMIFN